MNQLEYVPGIGGQSVQLDGPVSFVGIAENLRSREWEYDLGYRDLVSATRPAREVDVTFNADYETADELRRVADADVTARTPGTFIAQKDWRQRGYILASNPNDIHYGRLSTELKVALLDGAWWRLVDKTFAVEDTTPTYESATGKSVTTDGAANVPLHALTVDGEAVQDGTPTPSEPVPIEVIEGRNLFGVPTGGWIVGTPSTYNYIDGFGGNKGTLFVSQIQPNTTYTISAKLYTGMDRFRASLFDADPRSGAQFEVGHYLQIVVRNDPTSDQTYTFSSGEFTWIALGLSTSTTSSNPDAQAQLETGSAATPYVAPGCIGLVVGDTATSIPLQGNVLASLPDGTRDTVTVDGAGHCVLTKRIAQHTFNGSENWGTHGSIASWFYVDNLVPSMNYSKGTSGVASLSETHKFVVYTNVGSLTEGQFSFGIVPNATGTKRFVVKETSVTTKADFKTWLASNNLTFMYPLTTPQTIDLGYIDMPSVFDGAVVSITAEVTPTITAEWQTSPDIYLDYPHNYPYDYQKTSSTESITPSVLTPSDVRLVIYGPAVNPYVIVGDNRYQVNVTVPAGGYLTVDGRDKSILLTLADGTVQNVFSSGVRGGGAGGGSYIFEQIPAGESEVTYDGSFGFDLGWYEEEGEPPWSQS